MRVDRVQAVQLGTDLFCLAGAPADNAHSVAEHLVESSLMGLHSHGVIRMPEYQARIDAFQGGTTIPGGPIDPEARPTLERHGSGVARVDGHRGFGQVAAYFAADTAAQLAAENGVALVTAANMGHIGRLGAYAARVAELGFGTLAFCSGPKWGHWVSPFGGRDGRFATNPIAYAFPNAEGQPLVADFATSAITEGAVRYTLNTGALLPVDTLRNAEGVPTRDPHDLYTDPQGTIQPLGGATAGYKGTALGVLVELMSTIMAGESPVDEERGGNNMTLVAFAIDNDFPEEMKTYCEYVRSSRSVAPEHPVMMPGDRELANLARSSAVEFDGATWAALSERGERVGIKTSTYLPSNST